MKVLLITPPFTQVSSPYAAVPFLSGTLNEYGIQNDSIDLGLETVLKIFSRVGLTKIFDEIDKYDWKNDEKLRAFYCNRNIYIDTIDHVIDFLQGNNNPLAYRIVKRSYLPENDRFKVLENIETDDGNIIDYARHLSSLYIDDLADLINLTTAPDFYISKYHEKLAKTCDFNLIYEEVKKNNLIKEFTIENLEKCNLDDVKLIGITIPFPGNLIGAMIAGSWFKEHHPEIKIVFGGGYVNTELRSLNEPRLFEFTDFVTLDDGELPLLKIIDFISGNLSELQLLRTFIFENGIVKPVNIDNSDNIPADKYGIPNYDNISLKKYFSLIETTNPMHRLWSEKAFLKLRLSLGCYYHQCRFCDTDLPYIKCYAPLPVELIIKQISEIIKKTGINCFHFVDEALPPNILKELAIEFIKRKININFWGNARFEKSFTYDLCRLLVKAGLIALSCGLESASDSTLKNINKGFDIKQALEISANITDAGILLHTYLIYGLPLETPENFYNSIELVRQMFSNNIIDSAFYHRFSLTIHSHFYKNKDEYKLNPVDLKINDFANNDIDYKDLYTDNFDKLSFDIEKALYNFNYKNCLDEPIRFWFTDKKFNIKTDEYFVKNIIKSNKRKQRTNDFNGIVVFTGDKPLFYQMNNLSIISLCIDNELIEFEISKELFHWLQTFINNVLIDKNNNKTLGDLMESFPVNKEESKDEFIKNELFNELKKSGLLLL